MGSLWHMLKLLGAIVIIATANKSSADTSSVNHYQQSRDIIDSTHSPTDTIKMAGFLSSLQNADTVAIYSELGGKLSSKQRKLETMFNKKIIFSSVLKPDTSVKINDHWSVIIYLNNSYCAHMAPKLISNLISKGQYSPNRWMVVFNEEELGKSQINNFLGVSGLFGIFGIPSTQINSSKDIMKIAKKLNL